MRSFPKCGLLALWTICVLNICTAASIAGVESVRRAGQAEVWVVSGGSVCLEIASNTGEIVGFRLLKQGQELSRGLGGVHFIDGRTKQVICEGKVGNSHLTSATLQFDWISNQGNLAAQHLIRAFEDRILWKVTVSNKGAEQRLLELRLGLPIIVREGCKYWDGRGSERLASADSYLLAQNADPVLRHPSSDRTSTYIRSCLPMSCLYSERFGIAIGLEAHQFLCYFSSGVEPARSSRDSFYHSSKLVIDPGSEESVEFLLYAFPPRHGWRQALSLYYRFYPDIFETNADGRIFDVGVSGRFSTPSLFGPLWGEHCRRFYAGWMWSYAPFCTTGDCYPDEVHDRTEIRGYRTVDDLRDAIRQGTRTLEQTVAVFNYVIPQFCELGVAEKTYQDSWWVQADGSFPKPGVGVLHKEQLRRMYAWGNSYAENCLREIEQILTDFAPTGIAFDNASGGGKHYGGGVMRSPGRAFDSETNSVYSIEAVAYGKLMQKVRSMSIRGRRGAVAANTPITYLTAFYSDVALLEHSPSRLPNGTVHPLRVLMGRKPISWWMPSLAPKQWKHVPLTKENLTIHRLWCYLTGSTPCVLALQHSPRTFDETPILLQLGRSGWQPVTGARVNHQDLLIERFGEGLGAFLSVVNVGNMSVKGEAMIEWLHGGKTPYAFRRSDGRGLSSQLGPNGTSVLLALEDLSATSIQACFYMDSLAHPVKVDITEKPGEAEIFVASDRSLRGKCTYLLPPETWVEEVRINGKTVAYLQNEDRVLFQLGPSSSSKITIVRPPDCLVLPTESDVAKFPFLLDDSPNCAIVLGKGASAHQRGLAERLSRYFCYYLAAKRAAASTERVPPGGWYHWFSRQAKEEDAIPILEPRDDVQWDNLIFFDAKALKLETGAELPQLPQKALGAVHIVKTSKEKGPWALCLNSKDATAQEAVLARLLRVMDKTYSVHFSSSAYRRR